MTIDLFTRLNGYTDGIVFYLWLVKSILLSVQKFPGL